MPLSRAPLVLSNFSVRGRGDGLTLLKQCSLFSRFQIEWDYSNILSMHLVWITRICFKIANRLAHPSDISGRCPVNTVRPYYIILILVVTYSLFFAITPRLSLIFLVGEMILRRSCDAVALRAARGRCAATMRKIRCILHIYSFSWWQYYVCSSVFHQKVSRDLKMKLCKICLLIFCRHWTSARLVTL